MQTVIVTALRGSVALSMNTGSAMIGVENSGFERAHSISPRIVHFPRWEHRHCNAWIVSECVVSGPLIGGMRGSGVRTPLRHQNNQ